MYSWHKLSSHFNEDVTTNEQLSKNNFESNPSTTKQLTDLTADDNFSEFRPCHLQYEFNSW